MNIDPGKWNWRYKRPFALDELQCEVQVLSGMRGNFSTLYIDGKPVAVDCTPPTGGEAARNHILAAKLRDGRSIEVEAGYINWFNQGIAVRVDGNLVHESHPGRTIAMPDAATKMLEKSGSPDNYDPDVWKRNKIPLGVDIALGLLFFVIAKLTDLTTAALIGAGVGIALLIVQKITKIDLLGGLAMFGIVLLLISAALAFAYQSDDAVKYRTTVMGVITAALFLTDGFTGGKRLGGRMMRYLPYTDIDPRRLAIGLGVMGLIMAALNQIVAMTMSTDVWLYYSTFFDFGIVIVLIFFVFQFARGEKWRGAWPHYQAPPKPEPMESSTSTQ